MAINNTLQLVEKLTINKVPSEELFQQMISSGVVKEDELYLVENGSEIIYKEWITTSQENSFIIPFTLSNEELSSIEIFYNGLMLISGENYTISNNTIELLGWSTNIGDSIILCSDTLCAGIEFWGNGPSFLDQIRTRVNEIVQNLENIKSNGLSSLDTLNKTNRETFNELITNSKQEVNNIIQPIPSDWNNLIYNNENNQMGLRGKLIMDQNYAPTKEQDLLTKKYVDDNTFKIGDLLTSARTNLGDDWVLCNGDQRYDYEIPNIASLLESDSMNIESSDIKNLDKPISDADVTLYQNNKIALFKGNIIYYKDLSIEDSWHTITSAYTFNKNFAYAIGGYFIFLSGYHSSSTYGINILFSNDLNNWQENTTTANGALTTPSNFSLTYDNEIWSIYWSHGSKSTGSTTYSSASGRKFSKTLDGSWNSAGNSSRACALLDGKLLYFYTDENFPSKSPYLYYNGTRIRTSETAYGSSAKSLNKEVIYYDNASKITVYDIDLVNTTVTVPTTIIDIFYERGSYYILFGNGTCQKWTGKSMKDYRSDEGNTFTLGKTLYKEKNSVKLISLTDTTYQWHTIVDMKKLPTISKDKVYCYIKVK